MRSTSQHSGSTLVELLIFLALICLVIATALPILFSATETRLLQQTISIVEQNGTQILQNTSQRVRHATKIISPAAGQTGSVLVLQTSSGSTDPTIIGFSSGGIIIIEHTERAVVSSTQVAVQDFIVRNTSTSASRQSVSIAFGVSRTIRLQQPHSYGRRFEATFNLLPRDVPVTDSCGGCIPPYCMGNNNYTWQVCENAVCYTGQSPLKCP
jgi:type II secretory pathway pseudopilin PulG